MSGRAKRVLVYTVSLLIAPLPVMPYIKGTREFAIAVMACGAIVTLSSFYVVQGEIKIRPRTLLGNKLLAASPITLLFGMSLFVGAVVCLNQI